MKRMILLICVFLIICNIGFAETDVLIDFTQLGADFPTDDPTINSRTAVDLKGSLGAEAFEEEKRGLVTSLALDKWKIELASSSQTSERKNNSKCVEAVTAPDAPAIPGDDNMKSRTILGVRVMYPESTFNSYAVVIPPFEIQAYQDQDDLQEDYTLEPIEAEKNKMDKFEEGFGVLKNVHTIHSIEATVYGLNYPHALEITLQNQDYERRSYHLGYLKFVGWQKLIWTNPEYIKDVENRPQKDFPLYPREEPHVKFVNFTLYRDANAIGGDFIVYFKDVVVNYDQAFDDTISPHIIDEDIWGILETRSKKRREAEYKRMSARQLWESETEPLLHKETTDTESSE